MPASVAAASSYPADKVVVTLLHLVAISSTTYRLVHRFRIRRLWWDDYLSFIPLIVDLYFSSSIWFRNFQAKLNGPAKSRQQLFDSYWLTTLPFLVILWGSRSVLALSLARVFPSKHPARRWSLLLLAVMATSMILCVVGGVTNCKHASALLELDQDISCSTGIDPTPLNNVLMFAADIFGDSLLIITPIAFLWRVKLHPTERRLILVVVFGSILTLIVAIIFMILAMTESLAAQKNNGSLVNVRFHVEAATAVIVSNLVVVTTCLYQTLRPRQRPERPSTTESRTSQSCSPSRCICTSESDRSLTPITLTEISDFSSLHTSQQHTSITTDSSRNLLHYSSSQGFYSMSTFDIRETRRSFQT